MCIATWRSTRSATLPDSLPPRLLRAYLLTDYRAAGVRIRIGRVPPDALFVQLGHRSATLLTAWNPLSQRRPDGWNRRIQQRLRARLRRFAVEEAEGTLHAWREAMLLVGGDPRPAIVVARRFRQHGVVLLRRSAPARLVLLRRA